VAQGAERIKQIVANLKSYVRGDGGDLSLAMDFIDVSEVGLGDFSSMYWGLGARILRTARWIRVTPRCFGLHLTNFGCGSKKARANGCPCRRRRSVSDRNV
jgi:hypothetical protein